ncbi:heterokaryon incompatibility protein-domain-containing protein [Hypomontagnella monticulosa]|nr:heterokaryon incompatibility protein-domain-containing protein [Hypomontagnella monticulosa]
MRLLNTRTYEIHEFPGDAEGEEYAILSHTWGEDECTFQHMLSSDYSTRKGFTKIKYCCKQAAKEGLDWVWVDTCCIDKTNSSELSEAINSMFRWYKQATICYAYLADVTSTHEISGSRWLTRGWTLQELIAPKNVQFYTGDWRDLGSKLDLQDELQKITNIDRSVLSTGEFSDICIAKRMAWAAGRITTRVEDGAYCLLGIFDVNMPLLYGEGKKSFTRLQEEIMKTSDDHTLFAWGLPRDLKPMDWSAMQSSFETSQLHDFLADSPSDFVTEHDIRPLQDRQSNMPPSMFSQGVRIELPVWTKGSHSFAAISCYVRGHNTEYLGVPLFRWNDRYSARCGHLVLLSKEEWSGRKEVFLVKAPKFARFLPQAQPTSFSLFRVPSEEDYFAIDEVYCSHGSEYSKANRSITIANDQKGAQAVLFFRPRSGLDRYWTLKRQLAVNEHGLSMVIRGITHLFPFAIVLGSDRKPWAAFVPILREDNADRDFYSLLRYQKDLVRCCMTKTQMKHHVSQNREAELFSHRKGDHIDQSLRLLTNKWKQFIAEENLTEAVEAMEPWEITLCVKLHIGPANWDENTVFVCIQFSRRKLCESKGAKLAPKEYEEQTTVPHQEEFTPNWWEFRKLQWFPEV